MESYVERPPLPGLAGVVRTVWIQRTGAAAYVQRHLPTGGVEIHFPIGGRPQLVGPLTGPEIEVIPAHTTIVGVRFHPGTAPPLPAVLDELVDQRLGLAELWGTTVDRLVETMAGARNSEHALMLLQAHLRREFRAAGGVDPLVGEAVRALMPWHPVNIDTLAGHLALSASQLRRRCLQAVGTSPKVLQRTLRFQGFLALAQAGATAGRRRGADGTAGLAIDAGYADQAHLGRECLRLTGLTPRRLLGGDLERCTCGHDHSASYRPFPGHPGQARPGAPPVTPRRTAARTTRTGTAQGAAHDHAPYRPFPGHPGQARPGAPPMTPRRTAARTTRTGTAPGAAHDPAPYRPFPGHPGQARPRALDLFKTCWRRRS